MNEHWGRSRACIDLDNLCHNYALARGLAQRPAFAVVKADAYGHGALPCALALQAAGADAFAVATAQEALQLRRGGITVPLLLLGATDGDAAVELARRDVMLAVNGEETAQAYARALNRAALAAGVHMKVNTGMQRLGWVSAEAVDAAARIAAQDCFRLEGVFTHFAAADDPAEDAFTSGQLLQLRTATDALAKRGLHPMRHAANSAATLTRPSAHLDAVRPGLLLYGANPLCGGQAAPGLRPVLSLQARIVQVNHVAAGESISYGRWQRVERDSRIATVAMGYADGLLRSLSGAFDMLVRGARARQIGRICMDMCMLDVTDIEGVRPGDVATILGEDGGERITVEELASAAGTISYELLCAVGRRVPRWYYKGGQCVGQVNYVDRL